MMTERMSLRRIKAIIREHEMWYWNNRKDRDPSGTPRKTPLQGADLGETPLREAFLRGLDLSETDFESADLSYAQLSCSNLTGASFCYSQLLGASFDNSNLFHANLFRAFLHNIRLHNTKGFVFPQFPSITLLSSIDLGELPDDLTLELMRRDAYAHPSPGRFAEWAKSGADSDCPYQDEMRFWRFHEDERLWKRGNPTMKDRDLIVAICKAKGWGIKRHLKCAK